MRFSEFKVKLTEATEQNVVVIGDSIAVGINGGQTVPGRAVGGATPQQVLGFVQDFVKTGDAKGATVILSTGASNGTFERPNGQRQQLAMGPIRQQLRLLYDAGANIVLVGTGSARSKTFTNKYGSYFVNFEGEQVNQQLADIADAFGAKFLGPLENFDPGLNSGKGDGIHPFGGYKKLYQAAVAGSTAKEKTPTSELKKGPPFPGSLKELVKSLQQSLKNLGYSLGPPDVDGKYGPYTAGAVAAFKKDYGVEGTGDVFDTVAQATLDKVETGALAKVEKPTNVAAAPVKGTPTAAPMKGMQTAAPANGIVTGKAKEAKAFFMKKGWTPEQAAGIVGNLQAESGANLNNKAFGDGGKAYGIAQWHLPRQTQFKKEFGKDIKDSNFQEQLAFIQWELENTEAEAGQALKSAKTPEQAAVTFDQEYERSTGIHRQQRIQNALALSGQSSTKSA